MQMEQALSLMIVVVFDRGQASLQLMRFCIHWTTYSTALLGTNDSHAKERDVQMLISDVCLHPPWLHGGPRQDLNFPYSIFVPAFYTEEIYDWSD